MLPENERVSIKESAVGRGLQLARRDGPRSFAEKRSNGGNGRYGVCIDFCMDNRKRRREPAKSATAWCGRWDLNPYAFRHTPLKRTCLPIPALPRILHNDYFNISFYILQDEFLFAVQKLSKGQASVISFFGENFLYGAIDFYRRFLYNISCTTKCRCDGMADVLDSKSSVFGRAGSSPATGTIRKSRKPGFIWFFGIFFVFFEEGFSATGTMNKREKRVFRIKRIGKILVLTAFSGLRRSIRRSFFPVHCGKKPRFLFAKVSLQIKMTVIPFASGSIRIVLYESE